MPEGEPTAVPRPIHGGAVNAVLSTSAPGIQTGALAPIRDFRIGMPPRDRLRLTLRTSDG
jgi:hypothetical protein